MNKSIEIRNKLVLLVQSRKFWAAAVGLIVIIIKQFIPNFPISEEQITNIVILLVAYIAGTAIEDAGFAIGSNKP